MRKETLKFIGIFLSLSLFVSCDNNNDASKEDPQPEPPSEVVKDLGSEELANCYIVTHPGKYKFKADNQFNLGEGLPVPPRITPDTAGLIWQSAPDLIDRVDLIYEGDVPYVEFEVNKSVGNALLGVYDSAGEIEWSWHIWMPAEELKAVSTSSGYEIMNMNLGALNNEAGDPASYGMLYQWGRKDPFPAAATLTGDSSTASAPMYDLYGASVLISNSSWFNTDCNTIEYSISHPTVCLSNYSQFSSSRDWLKGELSDNSLWGNPNGTERDSDANVYLNKGRKTCYDPSPAGWRVPPVDVFRDFTSSGGYAWDTADFNVDDINRDGVIDIQDYLYGWHFLVNTGTPLFFPAAARFDGQYAMLMGSVSGVWGNYWSNSPYTNNGMGFCALSFQVKDLSGNDAVSISPAGGGSKADAYSIRCVRDK